jgi:superoxide dismutase, Fe-Mn family
MTFQLPALPYDRTALEPHMSAQTLDTHHGKHHAAYVKNLNDLLAGTPLASHSLEEVILDSGRDLDGKGKIFNNAAQVWNHTFFWQCMTPQGGGQPVGALFDAIAKTFGSLEVFKQQFKEAATTQFGSGWAWLVLDKGQLKITKTGNADLPLRHGQTALLTCDVWEHAYYLDYQNRRPDFVDTFLNHLVNWAFVAQNFASAQRQAA